MRIACSGSDTAVLSFVDDDSIEVAKNSEQLFSKLVYVCVLGSDSAKWQRAQEKLIPTQIQNVKMLKMNGALTRPVRVGTGLLSIKQNRHP